MRERNVIVVIVIMWSLLAIHKLLSRFRLPSSLRLRDRRFRRCGRVRSIYFRFHLPPAFTWSRGRRRGRRSARAWRGGWVCASHERRGATDVDLQSRLRRRRRLRVGRAWVGAGHDKGVECRRRVWWWGDDGEGRRRTCERTRSPSFEVEGLRSLVASGPTLLCDF